MNQLESRKFFIDTKPYSLLNHLILINSSVSLTLNIGVYVYLTNHGKRDVFRSSPNTHTYSRPSKTTLLVTTDNKTRVLLNLLIKKI